MVWLVAPDKMNTVRAMVISRYGHCCERKHAERRRVCDGSHHGQNGTETWTETAGKSHM